MMQLRRDVQARRPRPKPRTICAAAGLLLLAACGSFDTHGSGEYSLGAASYKVEVAEGKWEDSNMSGTKALEGRSFWYTEVKVTNDSEKPAALFSPALMLTVPASEAEIVPGTVDETGFTQTPVPSHCKYAGSETALSQTVKTRLITTRQFDGMPDGLCVFTMNLEGVRAKSGDGDHPIPDDITLDPGDSRVLTYSSATSFEPQDWPHLIYYTARLDVLDKAQGEYVALDE